MSTAEDDYDITREPVIRLIDALLEQPEILHGHKAGLVILREMMSVVIMAQVMAAKFFTEMSGRPTTPAEVYEFAVRLQAWASGPAGLFEAREAILGAIKDFMPEGVDDVGDG
jgi:hypothetical protein